MQPSLVSITTSLMVPRSSPRGFLTRESAISFPRIMFRVPTVVVAPLICITSPGMWNLLSHGKRLNTGRAVFNSCDNIIIRTPVERTALRDGQPPTALHGARSAASLLPHSLLNSPHGQPCGPPLRATSQGFAAPEAGIPPLPGAIERLTVDLPALPGSALMSVKAFQVSMGEPGRHDAPSAESDLRDGTCNRASSSG